MSNAKLTPLFDRFFVRRKAPEAVQPHRMQYEVVALCNQSAVQQVERIIHQYLLQLPQGADIAVDSSSNDGLLTRVCVRIWCAVPERAELVKLVSRLGLEKTVRSIRWTGVQAHQNHNA